MMNRDKETPEEFEKKRKELSLVSHDISRMHRCHINTRRVEVQEVRLDRDEEKTTEQLHFKFMEWVENPAIRRACILEPMEANRQTRKPMGMPPTSDDILVEKLTRNDPYFNPPNKKPTEKSPPEAKSSPSPDPSPAEAGAGKSEGKPNSKLKIQNSTLPSNPYGDKTTSQIIAEIEAGRTGVPPVSNPKSEPTPPPAAEKAPESNNNANHPTATPSPAGELRTDSHIRPIRPIGPTPPNSKPKHPLSEYERALLEGKPFLEALHIHITSKTKPTPPPPGTSPWDSICEPVRPSPYAHFSPPPASSFKLTFG
jgi:hypothetical protein